MSAIELTRQLLRSCLQLNSSIALEAGTPLLGGFPEFNSLTIATLIMQLEEAVDCEVDDEEITAELFETVGTLAEFIEKKMAAQ